MPEEETEPVLVMVELPASLWSKPTVAEAARHLGLEPGDLDAALGVVLIDPKRRLFAAWLRKPAATVRGPFADPPIGPMGRQDGG